MRRSGILLHVSSLPSPYGIGNLGKSAYTFIDFLKQAGQKCWQMLPIHPTGYGDSPYQGMSTFAGNHYLIDIDGLIADGLLLKEEAEGISWGSDPAKTDYGILYEKRLPLLYKAYKRFDESADTQYQDFVSREKWWLEDFALFMALKAENNQAPWLEWAEDIRLRSPEALQEAKERLQEQIRFHYFLQYIFYSQWDRLHSYAKQQGIELIGDVPIYVPLDSADVWAAPENFQLDESRSPIIIAGCPPDAFSATGQRWGNPIYDWERMKQDGFGWWISRLKRAAYFFDVVRIDHFRGIESYWAIPAQEETAMNGSWRKGPGMDLIRAIKAGLPDTSFIAEDLGYLTPEVMEMQRQSGFPGMKILQFAFDSREPGNYMPETYTVNSVCYTGTHDNETLVQWQQSIIPEDLQQAKSYLKVEDESKLCRAMICCGMSTVSDLFVAQLQDYLELGAQARMNHPSTLSARNWTWRAQESQITDALAQEIRELTERYKRI